MEDDKNTVMTAIQRIPAVSHTMKQVPFRLHANDHRALKSRAALDGLKMQTVVEALIMAYIDGNEHVRRVVLEHKALNTVKLRTQTWSKRESDRLLDDIEEAERKLEESE